ncbi:phospholipid/cholesterol/gamma-HCH transport system substrate-binding protein [Pseudonocardia hierapolitana]|uniref:Phospholipid/cholesterol/gamma-HCH transport system substrate-binding protein n=1 Tax=Pseudonocardia hierapolitana TaxID=1128676 RepID=A0A561STT1_9PSEU|nr:MCE family protein [Pseudonocardia hierapolitana]TWF78288.1 phospholipid/cholesterol/gamma-HCH transport system substrate-binding protein [Pseudonocardia hierapolitana]
MPGTRNPVATAIIGLLTIVLVVVLAFNGPALFGGGTTYKAEFREAAGLTAGDMVTVAGVEAGRVQDVELEGDHVLVTFKVTDAWVGDRTSASIQIRTLLGAKTLALDPQGDDDLNPDRTIPLSRTSSPFDVVEAFDGLSGTLDQIDTGQLAQSLNTLSDTFRDTPPEIRGALDGLSRLSTTIASRDEEIRRLLAGTHELAGVLADRNAEVEKLLKDGNLLLGELQRRREAISRLLDGTIALSEQLRGLVADNEEQLRPTLEQLDRVAALLQRNRDSLGAGIRDLAVFVRLFANATGNGEWFDNYICALLPPSAGPINPGGC